MTSGGGRAAGIAVLVALGLLAGCSADGRFDPDLRGLAGGGLDTAPAAAAAPPRPTPDANGIISYPGYQVAVARQGETIAALATRLGIGAAELARYNAIAPDAVLEPGAIIALPRRVAASAPATASTSAPGPAAGRPAVSTTGQVSDPFAGQAPARPAAPAAATSAAAAPSAKGAGSEPHQHIVAAGETAWSIARKYRVRIDDLASWNGLPPSMAVRTGQRLLIPVAGAAQPRRNVVSAPGVGSPTPEPPSAAKPLPEEKTDPAAKPVAAPPAPDLGATRTAASGSGRFRLPVEGAIIRTYDKGRNDGIDISAPPGSPVKAAAAGRVAAITRDTDNVPIVVIRHEGDLMTVYAGLDNLTVAKGDAVSVGQVLGKTTAAGVIHFEVRRGFESQDPEGLL